MSYSESVNQKYFEVEAKCGHVGKTNCIWIRFAVVAESRKDAAKRRVCSDASSMTTRTLSAT